MEAPLETCPGYEGNGGTAQTELGPPMGGKRDGDYPIRGSERKMKAIATRGRSYGKFFVGACWSREGWSFGFQDLEVVWGSHGGALGDMPRL